MKSSSRSEPMVDPDVAPLEGASTASPQSLRSANEASHLAAQTDARNDEELRGRASLVRLVLTDCDGVLTDTGVYYSDQGEALKRFSIRDGMGVERLKNAGISTAIVTGELSQSVAHRAKKLGIQAHLGVKDKALALDAILGEHGFDLAQVAFIGDDVNDLGVMARVGEQGLTGAPGDGMPEVRARAAYVTKALGGHGAFREFAEWILALRADDRSPSGVSAHAASSQ